MAEAESQGEAAFAGALGRRGHSSCRTSTLVIRKTRAGTTEPSRPSWSHRARSSPAASGLLGRVPWSSRMEHFPPIEARSPLSPLRFAKGEAKRNNIALAINQRLFVRTFPSGSSRQMDTIGPGRSTLPGVS